jgi:hypothetical protein
MRKLDDAAEDSGRWLEPAPEKHRRVPMVVPLCCKSVPSDDIGCRAMALGDDGVWRCEDQGCQRNFREVELTELFHAEFAEFRPYCERHRAYTILVIDTLTCQRWSACGNPFFDALDDPPAAYVLDRACPVVPVARFPSLGIGAPIVIDSDSESAGMMDDSLDFHTDFVQQSSIAAISSDASRLVGLPFMSEAPSDLDEDSDDSGQF